MKHSQNFEKGELPEGAELTPISDEAMKGCPGILGRHEAVYEYRDAQGHLVQLIFRVLIRDEKSPTGMGKIFTPYTLWKYPDGTEYWHKRAIPESRPLYRLGDLGKFTDFPVLIAEGEKCADAAADHFLDVVTVTWQGGASGWKKVDFAVLKGREIYLMPDNDEPGRKVMADLAVHLEAIGAGPIHLLDTAAIARGTIGEAREKCDVFDIIASKKVDGHFGNILTKFPPTLCSKEDAPQSDEKAVKRTPGHLADIDIPDEFELNENGLTRIRYGRKGEEKHVFISSPIVVMGKTTQKDTGWGNLVALKAPDGTWKTVVIPNRMLSGCGREMREVLNVAGAVLAPGSFERQALIEYIAFNQCDRIIEIADRTGWHKDVFVLPGQVIGSEDGSDVLPPDVDGINHMIGLAGSFDAWKQMAALASGSSRCVFLISAALSTPLSSLIGDAAGGYHICGESSRGKTSLLTVAGSVWGGGGREGLVTSWAMTANGGEALAALRSGTVLALDEFHLANPDSIREVIYRLINGVGKARATTSGSAARSAEWNTTLLSSGETTIESRMPRNRQGGTTHTGGVAVRMIDIPHVVSEDATFEDIGSCGSEMEFVTRIRELALTNYGHAGPAFVEAVLKNREEAKSRLASLISEFVDDTVGQEDDPQVGRVARRFAIVAAAGRLASEWGIVPWGPDVSQRAAAACFRAWCDVRGKTNASHEQTNAIRQVRKIFEAYSASRFERISRDAEGRPLDSQLMSVRDRWGYRETDDDGKTVFYVPRDIFKDEICGEHDPKMVARLLRDRGALDPADGRHFAKKVRLPDLENPVRVYVLRLDGLYDDEEDEAHR